MENMKLIILMASVLLCGIAWATEESVADTLQDSEEPNDAFETPVAEEDEVADPHTVITRVYRTETYTATAGTELQCKPHKAKSDCWYECGKKGGKCNFCGTGGYCCKKGWKDCPTVIANAAHSGHHSCVACKTIVHNKCLVNNGGCSHKCVFESGVAKCTCPAGFTLGSDEKSCSDVNECASGAHKCSANAVCTNTAGGYSCHCKPGFQGNGQSCGDINECASGKGGCSHNCVNTNGGYHCTCPSGYTMSSNKKTCADINECASGSGGCSHTCVNTNGGFHCACPNGWRLSGKTCHEICGANSYTCVTGKEQKGNDMATHHHVHSLNACKDLCCKTANCITFDYDSFWKVCWLSKTSWSQVPLSAGLFGIALANRWSCKRKLSNERVCPRYRCIDGKRQNGHDIAHSKETTEAHCAAKCCHHQGCIGYDYLSIGHDCWLSKTPWSKVAPSGGLFNAGIPFMKTCQSTEVHDEEEPEEEDHPEVNEAEEDEEEQ